jgi:hypothetical protein
MVVATAMSQQAHVGAVASKANNSSLSTPLLGIEAPMSCSARLTSTSRCHRPSLTKYPPPYQPSEAHQKTHKR